MGYVFSKIAKLVEIIWWKYFVQKHYRSFLRVANRPFIFLYAGDVPSTSPYKNKAIMGLSISQENSRHIKHNIMHYHDLPDNSVDIYQAEDVFEHIEYEKLEYVLKDIYRILKPNGLFRLSVPDYRYKEHIDRSVKSESGDILFDPWGGGYLTLDTNEVIDGGHLWFPKYETVKALIEKVPFAKVNYLHFIDENGNAFCNPIDYSNGYIMRTPEHDKNTRSIVVDCYK